MSKKLPAIGDKVYVEFSDIEECEVVNHIDDETIEVEHQVSDGMELFPVTKWFNKCPEDKRK